VEILESLQEITSGLFANCEFLAFDNRDVLSLLGLFYKVDVTTVTRQQLEGKSTLFTEMPRRGIFSETQRLVDRRRAGV
jgi:hypothetical protein